MTQKVALITGITGQHGGYLAEYLLKKGYIVHGIKRRTSLFNTDRIDHLYQDPHVENPLSSKKISIKLLKNNIKKVVYLQHLMPLKL